jgi:hypothetical protein
MRRRASLHLHEKPERCQRGDDEYEFRDRSSILDEVGRRPEIDRTPTVSWLRSPRSSWTLEDRSAVSATHGQAVVLVILDGDGPEHWRETQGPNAS